MKITKKWSEELTWVDIDNNEFWIKNRKYIQNDKLLNNLISKD